MQYNLSRKAKVKQRKHLNLTGDMLANVINVSNKLQEKDAVDRERRGDNSRDFLGLVQTSGFHDGFEACLFTKECLKVRLKTIFFNLRSTYVMISLFSNQVFLISVSYIMNSVG
jgi:hypothetical protein